jgi:hypothetical protein
MEVYQAIPAFLNEAQFLADQINLRQEGMS